MSLLGCFFCKDPSAKLCSCPSDPQPLCDDCLPSHKIAHSLRHADIICSTCDRVPVEMCIGCMSYICRKCSEKHLASCENKDIYPIEVYELAVKGEEGFRLLKRGKVVDNTVAYLRQILTTIRQKTLIEVESAFRSVEETLLLAKETVMTRLDEQIEKLGEEIGAFESRMNEVKYSESFDVSTNLEQLVFADLFPEIQSRLDSEQWFESVIDKALLSQISTDLVHVKKSTLLFSEVSAVCSWVGRYALLIGDEILFCDLDKMEQFQANFTITVLITTCCLQLPSGEYFLYYGFEQICYLIDNNYSNKTTIGTLPVQEFNPGLALFEDYIYVFGGFTLEATQPTRVIQRINLHDKADGELLTCEMIFERVSHCPCVYNKKVYLFGGKCFECEVFDPLFESIRFLPISTPSSGPSVVFLWAPSKIMILSGGQYIFDTETEKLTIVKNAKDLYLSHFHTLHYRDRHYFTVFEQQSNKFQLAYIEDGKTEVHKTIVSYKGFTVKNS